MSQRGKKGLVVLGVIFVLFGLWFTDNFVYPLKSESPNYADVERAFAKLQFPSGWEQIASSENKGMFGRGCDMFNDSGCFHKSRTFKVPAETTTEEVKKVLLAAGCPGVSAEESSPIGGSRYVQLSCGNAGLVYDGQLDFRSSGIEVYISVGTQ